MKVTPHKTILILNSQHYKNRKSIVIVNFIADWAISSSYERGDGTSQNLIQKEIKRRLNSGNICYHSVQNLLSSHLLSRNIKIRIYKTIILPVVLYGCETWSLTLKEEHGLRVFRAGCWEYLGQRDEVKGGWRKLHNEELHNLCSLPSLIRMIKSRSMRWAGHVARIGAKGECI
jgi:hypothetical protein